jgi:hypothetical protein
MIRNSDIEYFEIPSRFVDLINEKIKLAYKV